MQISVPQYSVAICFVAQIEELASTLSFSSRHSSLDSLASLDSRSSSPALGSPTPVSPAPRGRASPLHTRFRVSAKKALLMWVRDQCKRWVPLACICTIDTDINRHTRTPPCVISLYIFSLFYLPIYLLLPLSLSPILLPSCQG